MAIRYQYGILYVNTVRYIAIVELIMEHVEQEVPSEEKERTAVHEAGHAVVGWMLPWCEAVVKVSIVWRGNALGNDESCTPADA